MTVQELSNVLNAKILAGADGVDRDVTGCYSGDLLSWVMSRVQSGDAWLTVMGNVNAIAVASLADAACIVLTDSASLDEDARAKADQQNIAVLSAEQNSYETALKIAEILK